MLVLNSGGYDSTVLLHNFKRYSHKYSLFFNYGQPSVHVEAVLARQNAEMLGYKHISLTIPFNWGHTGQNKENTYYPFRNLIFLANALSMAETLDVGGIYAGMIKCPSGEYHTDSNPLFCDYFDSICSLSKENIMFITPLIGKTKEEVYELGRGLGINVRDTWSCDFPVNNYIRCGQCNDCLQLKSAIEDGILTPLEFFS